MRSLRVIALYYAPCQTLDTVLAFPDCPSISGVLSGVWSPTRYTNLTQSHRFYPDSTWSVSLTRNLLDTSSSESSDRDTRDEERSTDFQQSTAVDPEASVRHRGSTTIHFSFFQPTNGRGCYFPLRQWFIVLQLVIQMFAIPLSRDQVGAVGLVDGVVAHVLKLATWVLALAADRIRGSSNPIASPCLATAAGCMAVSATFTMDWPPDYTTALPVFQILDIVFLYSFFIVAAWSAAGCMVLGEGGQGMRNPRESEIDDKHFGGRSHA